MFKICPGLNLSHLTELKIYIFQMTLYDTQLTSFFSGTVTLTLGILSALIGRLREPIILFDIASGRIGVETHLATMARGSSTPFEDKVVLWTCPGRNFLIVRLKDLDFALIGWTFNWSFEATRSGTELDLRIDFLCIEEKRKHLVLVNRAISSAHSFRPQYRAHSSAVNLLELSRIFEFAPAK